MRDDIKLTDAEIRAIEAVLAKDQRIMLIPAKERLKIVRVEHKEIKIDK